MPKTAGQTVTSPKIRTNYLATIISLSILLYLLGIWGMIVIYANQFLNSTKEKLSFCIELKDDVEQASIFSFQKQLEASDFVKKKSVNYISKEEALEELDGGENSFLSKEDVLLFGDNLLPNIIQFSINKEHFSNYKKIVKDIESNSFVEEVFFMEAPAQNLSSKIYRLEIILVILMIFFIFVVITLLKNTLKLSFNANKSKIQTMQTVGATFEYMARPYISQSIRNGLVSALLAILFIWGTKLLMERELGTIQSLIDPWTLMLSGGILLIGVLVSWLCTKHSTRKYLIHPVEGWEL